MFFAFLIFSNFFKKKFISCSNSVERMKVPREFLDAHFETLLNILSFADKHVPRRRFFFLCLFNRLLFCCCASFVILCVYFFFPSFSSNLFFFSLRYFSLFEFFDPKVYYKATIRRVKSGRILQNKHYRFIVRHYFLDFSGIISYIFFLVFFIRSNTFIPRRSI